MLHACAHADSVCPCSCKVPAYTVPQSHANRRRLDVPGGLFRNGSPPLQLLLILVRREFPPLQWHACFNTKPREGGAHRWRRSRGRHTQQATATAEPRVWKRSAGLPAILLAPSRTKGSTRRRSNSNSRAKGLEAQRRARNYGLVLRPGADTALMPDTKTLATARSRSRGRGVVARARASSSRRARAYSSAAALGEARD